MSVSTGSTMNANPPLTLAATLPPTLPRAILFDMDGTLTQPLLDFDQIRRDIGIGNGPILESIKKMNPEEKRAAEKILHGHEHRAAEESTLNAGCMELLKWIENKKIETALVTRNTRQSVQTVFRRHGLHFDICITREDGKFKPDPAPLFLACEKLGIKPDDAWMVGDGYHDIEAGAAARMRTIWISHGTQRDFTAEPAHVVKDLIELRKFLEAIV